MEEIWKDIKDYEGYYQISNYGRVRSLDRTVIVIRYDKDYKINLKGSIMNCSLNISGYPNVSLHKERKRQVARVHRLVAEAFLDNPNNYETVNHIDSVKTNNRIDNLEWCTASDNRLHARNIFNDTTYGEECNLSKLTEDQVREIRANGRMDMTNEQIGKLYNVSHETIRCVLNGKSWKHIL